MAHDRKTLPSPSRRRGGCTHSTGAKIDEHDQRKIPVIALVDLAQRIRATHRKAEHSAREAVAYAVEAGQLLIEAKAQVPHGQWLPWITEHCEMAERTAQAYMRVARELPKLDDGKAQRVADMPLRDALRALAEPQEVVRSPLLALYRKALTEIKAATAALERGDRTDCEMHHDMARYLIAKLRDDTNFDRMLANDPDPRSTLASLAVSFDLEQSCARHRAIAMRAVGALTAR